MVTDPNASQIGATENYMYGENSQSESLLLYNDFQPHGINILLHFKPLTYPKVHILNELKIVTKQVLAIRAIVVRYINFGANSCREIKGLHSFN